MPLFLYGTLLFPELFSLVAGPGVGRATPATLAGWTVEQAPDGPWPALIARPGGRVAGVVWSDLSPERAARLDAYELPFGYRRQSVTVRDSAGLDMIADVYLPPAAQPMTGRAWSLDDWIATEAETALRAAAEVDWGARTDPAEILRKWPMVRARAAAVTRAGHSPAPAALRRQASPDDWSVTPAAPMTGDFFRLAALRVDHRRFDGGRNTGLMREVLVGTDAALVLPYDAARDRVLLIEQFRPGPARRGDPNPWVLEPVAGIIDPGEEPEACIRREAQEEAHLDLGTLERMFAVYPSPGNATDLFYCYLGHADLPDGHTRSGGLADEAEDIRIHVVSFDDAMRLLDSGEVTAAPLAGMLLWLARARPRLRAACNPGC